MGLDIFQERTNAHRHERPYQSTLLDDMLRAELRRMKIDLRDCEDALRDIAAVGALVDLKGRPLPRDINVIARACGALADTGIPVHPAPRLQLYNLLPPVSSDFLLNGLPQKNRADIVPRPNADFVVACYVFNYRLMRNDFDFLMPEQQQGYDDLGALYQDFDEGYDMERLTAGSAFHSLQHIWANSALNCGAKFIATYGSAAGEVATDKFECEGKYETLVKNEDRESFGFLVRHDHRQRAAAQVTQQTAIGLALK